MLNFAARVSSVWGLKSNQFAQTLYLFFRICTAGTYFHSQYTQMLLLILNTYLILIVNLRRAGYSTDYLIDFSIVTDSKNSSWRVIDIDQVGSCSNMSHSTNDHFNWARNYWQLEYYKEGPQFQEGMREAHTGCLLNIVFFRRFKNIPDSCLSLFSLGVSVCTHTRQVEHQRWSRTGRVQKNHNILRKKHNI